MIDITPTQPDSRTPANDSLLEPIRQRLPEVGGNDDLFPFLLEFCNASFQPLIARCEFRAGGREEVFQQQNSQIQEDLAAQLQHDFLNPMNAEIRQAGAPEPTLRRFETKSGPQLALVAAPMINVRTGAVDGAMSMIVSDADGRAVHVLARMQAIVDLLNEEKNARTAMIRVDREAGAIQNLADCRSVREFAFSIANSLCNRVECEQVGFGLEKGRRIELLAISGTPRFKTSSPGVALQTQAMEECLDAKRVVVHQSDQNNEVFPIHRKWSVETGASCVLSLPLLAGDDIAGVISLRRPTNEPFSEKEIAAVHEMVQPYASAVRLLDRATAPLSAHVKSSLRAFVARNRKPVRLVCWAALVTSVYWFIFGSMLYRPMCTATVVSANLRHFAAPFNGKLEAVHVQPGDSVTAGQLLVEFDVRQQQLERQAILAELAETQIRHREALQSGDASMAALQQAHIDVLTAQSGALEEQINRARFRAPEDGVVLQADLTKRIGEVFPQGEAVLQFAPRGGWSLEIHVPDHVASHVAAQQVGYFSASASPGEEIAFTLAQVDGSASVVGGQNVFVARAPLDGNPGWMMDGMQGFARIETRKQPVWWVASHGIIDWFRTTFWF